MNEVSRKRLINMVDVIRSGGLSLREQVVVQPTEQLTDQPSRIIPGYERFLPPMLGSLDERVDRNPNFLRESFADMLVNMANEYDLLDHQYSPDNTGTELQKECQAARELARSFDIP